MRLHHLGFIVKDLEQFAGNMLVSSLVKEAEDPVQHARLALYKGFSDAWIELIQPLNAQSFTWNFLQKNGEGFHHLCYEATLDEIMKYSVEKKLVKVLGPVPAVLFDGQDVMFYVDRNKTVVEFFIAGKSS
jgi:methylmalonyl-CoA/ethylmalonyl-CoA epimerase